MTIFAFKVTHYVGSEPNDTMTESGITFGETDIEAIDNLFDMFGTGEDIQSISITPLNPEDRCFIFPNEVMEHYLEEYVW